MPFSMFVGFSVMFLLTISVIIAVTPSDSNLATWAKANKDLTSDGENLQYVIYVLDGENLKLQITYLKTR